MRRALLAIVIVGVACGSSTPKPIIKPAPSASASVSASAVPSASASVAEIDPHFREHEPPPGPDAPLVMPELHDKKLANGMRVISANTGGGMFAMRLVFEGTAAFPAERPAAIRLMVRSLFGGTPSHDAHELRRVLEKHFAQWQTNTAADAITMDMSMPADDINPCVDIMADVVQHAGLDQQTLGFELLQIVEQGQTAREVPSSVSSHVLERVIYGDTHGYARTPTVLEGSPIVERVEVVRDYDSTFDPTTTTIVLAGAVDAQTLAHVERAFSTWRPRTHAAGVIAANAVWRSGPRLVVVDRPGLVQSQVTFGALAPAASSADWYAMDVIHEILGAHRSSRLPRAFEGSGATHLDTHRAEGSFYWDSSVPIARTAKVLTEVDRAFRELGQTAVPSEELEARKTLVLRQIPAELETAHDTAALISTIPVQRLSIDALDRLAPGIRAVTADAVRSLAQTRLAADHTRAVVVGDWAKLKTDLKALGWGAIEIRDNSGKLIRTEK